MFIVLNLLFSRSLGPMGLNISLYTKQNIRREKNNFEVWQIDILLLLSTQIKDGRVLGWYILQIFCISLIAISWCLGRKNEAWMNSSQVGNWLVELVTEASPTCVALQITSESDHHFNPLWTVVGDVDHGPYCPGHLLHGIWFWEDVILWWREGLHAKHKHKFRLNDMRLSKNEVNYLKSTRLCEHFTFDYNWRPLFGVEQRVRWRSFHRFSIGTLS